MCAGFWWGNGEERNHLADPGVEGSLVLKYSLKQDDERAWTGLIWLREGTCDGDRKLHTKRVKV